MTQLFMNQFNQTSGCRRHAACGACEISASDWSESNACIDSMDWSVLNTLCKVIYSCVISVTILLLDTKMLQSSLASSNVPLLLLLCFITVEFVDSLLALVALLLDFVGTPRFFVLPAALLDCVTVTRPFISIDQFKIIMIGI